MPKTIKNTAGYGRKKIVPVLGKTWKILLKQSISRLNPSKDWQKKIDRFIIDNDIRDYRYLDIDKQGRIKTEYWDSGSNEDVYLSTINHRRIFGTYDYAYDEKDWNQKSRCKTALKSYYPVRNNNLLVKLNRVKVPNEDDVYEDDGKVWKDYTEYIYIW